VGHTREVPGDDLANDAKWFMEGVDELGLVGFDCLTVNLVGPSSIVSDSRDREGNIRVLSPLKGLACGKCRQVPGVSASGSVRLD